MVRILTRTRDFAMLNALRDLQHVTQAELKIGVPGVSWFRRVW